MTDRPYASLSLDLDNAWSYLKTRGDASWESFPSYFDIVVPRILNMHHRLDLPVTVFIVGQDADIASNVPWLQDIAKAGHEIGNHSYKHEPWLHLYSPKEVEDEIASADRAIFTATGKRPRGFRGPGFSFSPDVLNTLRRRGYTYDASTFPTIIGPLARLYYFARAPLSRSERKTRDQLFGSVSDGFRPLNPFRWDVGGQGLIELPVTTMPMARLPFHLSYLQYLAGYSQALARRYFEGALSLCTMRGIAPSFLLHPLDFIGKGEVAGLDFFPAMDQPADKKLAFAEWALSALSERFEVIPMSVHAERAASEDLSVLQPDFRAQPA